MTEGWHNDHYLILLEETESKEWESTYDLEGRLPGYRLIGLFDWDDFIVIDSSNGSTYRVPTVPMIEERKEKWSGLSGIQSLQADERFTGKIKWYIKPLIFGGSPNDEENLSWVSHDDHSKLVKYWNDQYTELSK